jgi:hypothetical protein
MIEKKIAVCIGTDRTKHFIVRLSLMIVDNGTVLSESFHRIHINPGDDLSLIRARNESHLANPDGGIPGAPWPQIPDSEWAEVEQLVGIVHTAELVSAYRSKVEEILKQRG